ncbi:MAG: hypothetical protein C5B58_15905 [Acidobacteria bacterium]|nr:MAG: hypothetical protein C5B58_15905 [Acidobacteriota bacterium]
MTIILVLLLAHGLRLFFGASGVRILLHFAGFCRTKTWILFVFRVSEITLDQHIGVRIPGGQPN